MSIESLGYKIVNRSMSMEWVIEVFKHHISFYHVDENDIVRKRYSHQYTIGM